MAAFTQIQLWSKERDEHGFPKKYSIYLLAPTLRIGDAYSSPILRVRDSDYRITAPTSRMKAASEDDARNKFIDFFKQEATRLGVDFLVTELREV